MSKNNTIIIYAKDFDEKKLSAEDPHIQVFKLGQVCTSNILYDGKSNIFVHMEEVVGYFNAIFDNNASEEAKKNKDKSAIAGYQIIFNVKENDNNKRVMDALTKFNIEEYKFQCTGEDGEERDDKDLLIPAGCAQPYTRAEKKNNYDKVVKPLCQYPRTKESNYKEEDTTKPQRCKVKFIIRKTKTPTKEGFNFEPMTRMFDEENNYLDPYSVIGKKFKFDFCVKIESIYWGGHGSEPHQTSLRVKVAELYCENADDNILPEGRLIQRPVSTKSKNNNTDNVDDEKLLDALDNPDGNMEGFSDDEDDDNKGRAPDGDSDDESGNGSDDESQ